jgi:prephenate dehydrogenase
MVGVNQVIGTALYSARAGVIGNKIKRKQIKPSDISTHSTLTSQYLDIGSSRVLTQDLHTYSEILCSNPGILNELLEELEKIKTMADKGDMEGIEQYMKRNAGLLGKRFLRENMKISESVDKILE